MEFRKLRTLGGYMNRIGSPAPQKYEITVDKNGSGKYLSLQSKEFDGHTMKLVYGRADKPPSNKLFQKLQNAFKNPTNVRSGLESILTPVLKKNNSFSNSIGTQKANHFKAMFFEATNQNSSSQKVDASRFLRKITENSLNGNHSNIQINDRQVDVEIKVT
jgi:hypothetical protein